VRKRDSGTAPAFERFSSALQPAFGGDSIMLRWALIFFILALVAAFFGFGGIAASAAWIAKLLFFGFLIVAVVMLISNLSRGRAI
jgi:uncharacterized membrane protein YtjA (UPF0391 family)